METVMEIEKTNDERRQRRETLLKVKTGLTLGLCEGLDSVIEMEM